MLYKKGQRDDFGNYRAICLLCQAYKLLSAVVARRLMDVLDGHLPDTQAGFRPARGCRDNVGALRWFIAMVLREGRHAVITFIDYSAAFDTESQLFLASALADAGVSVKVGRIIHAIFAAATGVVRIRQPSGDNMLSDSFNIERGVLQGDIFSPVCFIAGLDRIFRLHDVANSGMVVGEAERDSREQVRVRGRRRSCGRERCVSFDPRHGTRYWLHDGRCNGDLHQKE